MANQYTAGWTEEEDDFLYDNVGKKSYDKISEHLGRSIGAIITRVQRLGIEDKHAQTGTLSARQLSMYIGIDHHVIVKWIKQHGLPAKQRTFINRKPTKYKPYFILPEDFWKWVGKNKELVNLMKYEEGSILPEPSWLKEKLRYDIQNTPKRSKLLWTPEEDTKLWNLYYGLATPQKEIALLMNRSVEAVQRRLSRLRKQRSEIYASKRA